MDIRKYTSKIKLKKNRILQLFISILSAIVVFVAIIYLQKQLLAPNGMTEIIVAKEDIQENQLITEENYDAFFKTASRDSLLISSNTIKSKDEIINKVVKDLIIKGNGLSEGNLLDKDSMLLEMQDPVEYSLMASDIGQVVGGMIREGDIINIGVINETTKQYEEPKTFAYVNRVLRSDGTEVRRNEEGSGVVINIITSNDEKANIESKIATGKVVISKVMDIPQVKK